MQATDRSSRWLIATLFVAGCGGGGTGNGGATVADSAGVTLVSNVEQGLWEEGQAWSVEPDLRVGAAEGAPEYRFGRIGWLTVAGDGSIYVLDQRARHIRRFDADGRHISTFGELGDAATFIGRTPGDTLIVADLDNQRLALYGPDGRSFGTVPILPGEGLPVAWENTPSGAIARQVRRLPMEDPTLQPDSLDAIIAVAADGTDADTLMRVPSGGSLSLSGGAPNVEIFAAEPIWSLTDDLEVLYGVNDDYRIGIYQDGELRRVFSKPFTPQRVTEADRRAVLQGLLGLLGDVVPEGAIDQLSSLIRFNETFPVIAAVAVGPEATVWVQRTRSPNDILDSIEPNIRTIELLQRMGGRTWDVFDPDGLYLGPVELPDRFTARYFTGDFIYGVWLDELEVEYVMRLRVVRT